MAAPILPLVLASAPEGAAGPDAHFGVAPSRSGDLL